MRSIERNGRADTIYVLADPHRVETELLLSAADAKYVRELEGGLVPPRRADRDIGKAFAALAAISRKAVPSLLPGGAFARSIFWSRVLRGWKDWRCVIHACALSMFPRPQAMGRRHS